MRWLHRVRFVGMCERNPVLWCSVELFCGVFCGQQKRVILVLCWWLNARWLLLLLLERRDLPRGVHARRPAGCSPCTRCCACLCVCVCAVSCRAVGGSGWLGGCWCACSTWWWALVLNAVACSTWWRSQRGGSDQTVVISCGLHKHAAARRSCSPRSPCSPRPTTCRLRPGPDGSSYQRRPARTADRLGAIAVSANAFPTPYVEWAAVWSSRFWSPQTISRS